MSSSSIIQSGISLCIETSTAKGSICFLHDQKVLFYKESLSQKTHAETIHAFVQLGLDHLNLKISDLEYFVCGIGPGSFTGVRIALNAIKTYAYLTDKKIVAVNSLECLAYQASQSPQFSCDQQSIFILPMINAFKNMVYCDFFDGSSDIPRTLGNPEALFVKEIMQIVPVKEKFYVLGDGTEVYRPYLPKDFLELMVSFNEPELNFPNAQSAALLGRKKYLNSQTMDWTSLLPLYLRASEAEENKSGLLLRPLN